MALSAKAREFLERYRDGFAQYARAASEAEAFVKASLSGVGVAIHGVTGRPKSLISLRRKARTKRYANPKTQLTDLVGVRVITYYARDMDPVVEELRASFEVSEKKSRDARKALDTSEFGYRSAHLIVRLRKADAAHVAHANLKRLWFEIQVRSILDHAWTEIEHEAVYKSGIRYPASFLRRFHAVAGALEVLEDVFAQLSVERATLIEGYRVAYAAGRDLDASFDVARLLAYLEAFAPEATSWRSAADAGTPVPAGLDVACLEAFHEVGVESARQLNAVLTTKQYARVLQKFAAMEGLAPTEVSHLGRCVLAIAVVNARVLRRSFGEILFSPSIDTVVRELE